MHLHRPNLSRNHLSKYSVHTSKVTSQLLDCFVFKTLCSKTKQLISWLVTEYLFKWLRLKLQDLHIYLLALIDVHLALIEHCICCNPSKLINGKSSKTSGITIGILVEICTRNSRVICQKVAICQHKNAKLPTSIILVANNKIVGNNQDFFFHLHIKFLLLQKNIPNLQSLS